MYNVRIQYHISGIKYLVTEYNKLRVNCVRISVRIFNRRNTQNRKNRKNRNFQVNVKNHKGIH